MRRRREQLWAMLQAEADRAGLQAVRHVPDTVPCLPNTLSVAFPGVVAADVLREMRAEVRWRRDWEVGAVGSVAVRVSGLCHHLLCCYADYPIVFYHTVIRDF
jgi:hypothetical protein